MKVPTYERQVGLTAETPGVLGPMAPQAPQGSLEQAGLPYQKLQELGGALTQIGAEVKRRMDHGRQLKDLNDANFAAEDQNIGLQGIVKENPDPNTWVDLYKQGMLDYKEISLSNLSDPEVQAAHTKHVDRLFFSGLKSVQAAADKQNASIYLADVEPNLQKDAGLYVQASGNDLEQARIKGQAFGRLDAGVAARVIYPAKAQQLKQNWENYVTLAQGNQDVLQDPMGAFERLGDPAKNYPGMDAQSALALRGRAQTEVHRIQQANADNLDNQFMRGTGVNADPNVQLPTQQQIYDLQKSGGLASHDAWRFDKILEGMKNNPGDKSDPSTKTRLWSGIVPDDDGKITTTREMILDPQNQLSANDRIAMLKDLRATDRQDTKGIVTFERGQLSSIKNALGPNYYQRFYNDYLTEKKTANWGTEAEIEQNINRIADPWLQKVRNRGGVFTNQPPAQPGWGTTIRNFVTGGGDASTQPPTGTMRVLNKRTGQMESVTPEQFNQIQQYQRGQR